MGIFANRVVVASFLLFASSALSPLMHAVDIQVPRLLAVELPNDGMTSIPASQAPMSTLLNSVTAGGLQVTHDQVGVSLAVGGTLVTWTAWTGAVGSSSVAATRSEYVYVFRHGMTPIGRSFDEYATAGNHGSCIARDLQGRIHVAWLDTDFDGYHIRYRRGVQSDVTGDVTWTDPVDVDDGTATWDSYVAISATAGAVHFAWAGNDASQQILYRRLRLNVSTWTFEPIRATGAYGVNWDNGPDIAAYIDDEVHIMSSDRQHAYTLSAGTSAAWTVEQIDLPSGCIGSKYPAISAGPNGDLHLAFTAMFRQGDWQHPDPGETANFYWTIWYMHRTRPLAGSPGSWIESHDALADFPEWQDPGASSPFPNDAAADWVDINADLSGNVHLGWHGTAFSRMAGDDDAFYTLRAAAGNGNAHAWAHPQALHTAGSGFEFSFTPSLCASDYGHAFPVFMYKALGAAPYDNYSDLDSAVRVFKDGALVDGGKIDLSHSASLGFSTWWPDTSSRLYRHGNGRAWLDIIAAMDTQDGSEVAYIVYQRNEVTSFLPAATPNWTFQPPKIGASRTNWTMTEDVSIFPQSFLATDPNNPGVPLIVTCTSSNTTLIPNENLIITYSGTTPSLAISPAPNQNGSATITMTLSDGAVSESFQFPLTVSPVNDKPTISDIANVSTSENVATPALPFTVADIDSATLTISASSNNTTLIPNANLALAGSGADRTITVTPAANQSGSATITVIVSDGSLSASDTFIVTVTSVNHAPTITAIADATISEDTTTGALAFTIGDSETPASSLTVTASSSNTALIPNATIALGGSGTSRSVTVTPAANQTGVSTITVTVSDGSLQALESFDVTVTPVNDAPTISDIANVATDENVATPAIPFTIGDIDSATLTVTALSSNTALIPNANLALGGSGSNRTITATPAAGQAGSATITVSVSDGSLSANDTFVITVNAVNHAPTISAIDDVTISEDSATGAIAFTIGDAETPANALSVSASSSDPALIPDANIALGGSGSSRTVTATPDANQSGSATITVTVGDGALSASESFVVTVTPANDPPSVASISATPASTTVGTSIAFAVNASDIDGDALTYSWTFGDGANGSGSNPTHAYASAGSYIARVSISDGHGGFNSANVTVTVAAVSDLVAHWKFDDSSGSSAADSSGHGFTGALVGGPSWISGRIGSALSFTGSNHVQVADAPALQVGNGGADFSVSYWIYLKQGATGLWRSIMHKGNADTERTFAMWMHPSDNGIHYRISTTGNWNAGGDSAAQLALNAWTHIAYVKTGGMLQLYVNGSLDSQVALPGATVGNAGPLTIGKDAWYSGTNCNLDDVRIYNRALSGSEVSALNNVPSAPSIVTQPSSQIVALGQTATFSVVAAGTAPLSYQWQKNGSDIGGATGATYTTPATILADSGASYTVVVSNSVGSATSDPASLTVTTGSDPNLIAWWKLDDGSGSVAADSSGNNFIGALAGGPSWTSGRFGGALGFAGSDYLQVNNVSALEVGKANADFSVGCWLYLKQGATGAWRNIAHKGNADTERTFAMWLWPSENRIHYRVSTTANWNEGTDSAALIPLNAWTHLAYVKSGSVLRLYINGALDSQVALSAPTVSNTGPITFGKDAWYSGINGNLDDIRVYNKALSAADVSALVNVATAPSIATQPANQTVGAGLTATFSVVANGSAPLSYQWQKNGFDIGGATGSSYTTPATAPADSGSTYSVLISNPYGSAPSSAATLTVTTGDPSLIGWYRLDDGSGATATDSSSMAAHGTLLNGPAWTSAGVVAGALGFDGANDYVSVPDAAHLRLTGDMTIAFWMRKNVESADWQRLVGKGNPTFRNYGIWEETGAGKRILFQQYDASGNAILNLFSASNVEAGMWCHVTCVVSGSTAILYLNGSANASGTRAGIPGTSNDPLTFAYAGYHNPFPGALDDIRIYNRALSAAEIANLVQASTLVLQGGFEAPVMAFGNFQYGPTGSAWAFAGGGGISNNASGFTGGNPNAPEGSQICFLQNLGTATQTVSGFEANMSYTFSLEAARRGNWGTQQTFKVELDGALIGTFSPSSTSYTTFTTSAIAPGAGSHVLTLSGLNSSGDATVFIDNVRVSAEPVAPTGISMRLAPGPRFGLDQVGSFLLPAAGVRQN